MLGMLHNSCVRVGWVLAWVWVCLLVLAGSSYISMSVSASNLQINSVASYTFILNRQYDPVNYAVITNPAAIPLNSLIKITFPSQFLAISSSASVGCTDSNGNNLDCTFNSATNVVTVGSYYATASTTSNTLITIVMGSIQNAYKAGPCSNFYWEISSANGTVIDQGPAPSTNYISTSLTFVGGIFSSCLISASAAYVSSYSTLTFTLTPTNQIPAGGQLVFEIPGAWASDPTSVSTLQSTPSCVAVSGLGSSMLTCSYNHITGQLTVTGNTASISSVFSLTIASILTPPAVGSGETITIYSQWSDGTSIDSCTALVGGLVAAPFQGITLASNDNSTVQSSFTATLSLTLSRAFYYQDTIAFILPSQFASATVTSSTFVSFTRTAGLNNTLTLDNFPSSTTNIASQNIITFTLSNIANALSTVPLTLNVTFYRSNQIYQTSTVSYSAVAGLLSSSNIVPTSNFVQAVGQAAITLVSALSFPAQAVITLTYPASITANTLSSTAVTRCSLNSSIVVGSTFVVANNQIVFSGVFAANFAGTVALTISGFINPPTTQPSAYTIAVTDQNGYAVMSGSFSLTANTRALISNSVSAGSGTVLATGVTYTLSITTNYAFTAVSIIIPSDISIGAGFGSTCAPNSFSSCSLSGQNLTFVGSLAAGSYQLSWGYTTNPSSLQPTASFSVTTYSNGWPVQNSQGVISVSMNASAAFRSAIAFPSSYTNSAVVSVNVALTLPSGSPAGQITVTFPSVLGLSSASCTGCTIVPPFVYYTISSGVTALTLTINNVQNVASFQPISSFSVALTNSNSYASLSSSIAGWTNTQPSSFVTTVSASNNYKGEANTFIFALSGLPGSQSYVVVSINSAFPAVTSVPASARLVNSYEVSYPCTGTSCSLNLPLINPTASGSYTFGLTSYNSGNYEVATSTSNSWTYDCSATECRSCLANGSCLSCYSSTISSFYIINTAASTCIRACPAGFFLLNTTCTPCSSNCSECQGTSANCTTCPATYYLQTTYALCVPSCLNGYFANALNMRCTLCSTSCATCSGTASSCLSCATGTYLYGSTCPATCPVNYFINNVVTLRCDPCNTNCLTCTGTTTNCTSCNNTQGLYYENNKCLSVCSANYFLVSSVCTYCQTPCRVCSGAISVCASCFLSGTAPVFFNMTCISSGSCPIGHYINSTNSSCETCPSACSQCTSPTICSSCTSGFYLNGFSCITVCPNTTYPVNSTSSAQCQTCSGCATCTSVSSCTSCVSSQYLYLSICYSSCPNGTYSSGSNCAVCVSNCPTCQNLTYCLSCVGGMYLLQGVCYGVCPSKYYASSTVCAACPTACATCTSATVCQTCASGFSLQGSQCVQVCSVGLSYNQTCWPCGLSCSICNSTTGVCSLCATSYLLYNNSCVGSCPSNMLTMDNINCVLCTQRFVNCSTCSSSACLSCTYGQLLAGSCQPCNPGTYDLSGSCATCPSTCAVCTSQSVCQSCVSGNYLQGTICSSNCPANMVPNGTVCSLCAPQCSVCSRTTNLCTVCNAGVYFYDNSCYSNCPSGLVVSYDFFSCVTEAVYYQQFSSASKIIPFPFTIAALCMVGIGLILRCQHGEVHLQTALCALVGLIEVAAWVVFVGFQYIYSQNYHKTAFLGVICGAVGLALLVFFNCIHLRFFYKYAATDDDFVRWSKSYSCANGVILTIATVLTFKFYRLVHSKLMGRNELSMQLTTANKLVPFTLLGVLSVLGCSAPLSVGCALALYNSISQDQQFYIAMDVLVVTGIMVLLILLDMRHPDDYFSDEHENKHLKRKIYEEDQIKFQPIPQEGRSEISSGGIIAPGEEEDCEGLPSSANKFKSTFHKTKQLPSETKLKVEGQAEVEAEVEAEEDFQFEEQLSGDECTPQQNLGKWQPIKYDHHGYTVKYDAHNNPVRYDEHGYLVEIDEEGKHTKYNSDGNEVRIENGKHLVYDKDGYLLIDGVPHDQRGYQVREQDGEKVFYNDREFKVVGYGQDEKMVDQEGNIVKIDHNGNIRRYRQDGLQIVNYKGQKLLKNQQGKFVRQNSEGQWQMYDPDDGFTLKKDPATGAYLKYDDLGFRVEIDKFGVLRRYDESGNLVTILPGGTIVKHDSDGYRVEVDAQGRVHRFDSEGYELVLDSSGKPRFIDQNGYTVQRDLYGRVTLYDEQGLLVIIDPETRRHRKFNEEGLEVIVDGDGVRSLRDKRGRTVKEMGETFEKYDEEGNRIFLDDNGYEVQDDGEGNVVMYDKVGDRVETDYDIIESESEDQFHSTLLQPRNGRPLRYKYKPTKAMDNEFELQKLMSANQLMAFEEQSQISELREFHDEDILVEVEVDHQLEKMVSKERSELLLKEEDGQIDLIDFQFKEEEEEVQAKEGLELQGLQGLVAAHPGAGADGLADRQAGQMVWDEQAMLRDNYNGVNLVSGELVGGYALVDRERRKQGEFDNQAVVRQVEEPRMQRIQGELLATSLVDREQNRQKQFDGQAVVREMDELQPDVLALKQQQQRIALQVRRRQLQRMLQTPREQQNIEIRSVADVSLLQRSFQNEGVQPMQNRTEYDEVGSLDGAEVTLGRRRVNRSDANMNPGKKNTQTVYNFNTVEVEIKNQNKLYDEEEEIESLHQEDWEEQNAMVFARRERVKEEQREHTSNANTNIFYVENEELPEGKDALSDLLHQSESKSKARLRYPGPNEILSGRQSIEEIEEQMFEEEQRVRERRGFKLSGAPNPLVEYAKAIEANRNRKSLQEKMYLDNIYKR